MPEPIVLLHSGCGQRWPSSEQRQAVDRELFRIAEYAQCMLKERAEARTVAVEVVALLEDCPLFNAGKGAALTIDGDHELEAGVVDGASGKYGAVSNIRLVKNPIRAANRLLEHGPHRMLVGPAADAMASRNDLGMVENDYFTTVVRRSHLEQLNNADDLELGTVGAIVLDHTGALAAAGSTGGITGKAKGRIGDTAVLGAGLYADSDIAVVCSGAGDEILQSLTAAKVARLQSEGLTLDEAAAMALADVAKLGQPSALLALNVHGVSSVASTARVFSVASVGLTSKPKVGTCTATSTLFPQAIVYEDELTVAGLANYPNTLGHTKVELRRKQSPLLLQADAELIHVMMTVKKVGEAIRKTYDVRRCALVSTGGATLSVIPLHGLGTQWESVTSDEKVFHATYPGYVSSHDGPSMSADDLKALCERIQKVSRIPSSFNYNFKGDASNNIFARIVRGELPQSRLWEDDDHVAFLTPYANTPGFTVLVPRAHLSSDILALDDHDYIKLILAAKKVARVLTKALGVMRCGMIFEGFEIDYAHVKLIPINDGDHASTSLFDSDTSAPGDFHSTYPGFVTSLDGHAAADLSDLHSKAVDIRKLLSNQPVVPPKSWTNPHVHFSQAIQSPWYECVLALQDTLFHASTKYFRKTLGYRYALVPATTDAISSPMGLGSDSQPVPVRLLGQNTHLADSMQFALEYFLRIGHGLPGTYYTGCSFRGEDTDTMHLSQFYHMECELVGGFAQGVKVAEQYIVTIVRGLIRHHSSAIKDVTGTLDHMQQLLDQYDAHSSSFPQISLERALALPGMTDSCWKYVVADRPNKGRAITREGERLLIKHFRGAVWLTDMDHISVPFYQAYTDSTHAKAKCADLLLGNGEILGLGERHVSSSDVITALSEHEVPSQTYEWYYQMRDLKPMLTTGWGLGIERFLAWILQHEDIRDIAIIPRLKGSSFAP